LLNHSKAIFRLLDRGTSCRVGSDWPPLGSHRSIDWLILSLSIAHSYLRRQGAIGINGPVQSLVLHVNYIHIWILALLISLVNTQPLSFLEERVSIELLLECQLSKQLSPITSRPRSRGYLLNSKVNLMIIRLSENRVRRHALVHVLRLITAGYSTHFLVVGQLVVLVGWG
jgi:hypothetical protein